MLDQRERSTLGHGDDGQTRGLGLEDDLSEGVGCGGEEEEVRGGVGVREGIACARPAEEGRVLGADALAQAILLGAAAGEHEVQAGLARVRAQESVGEQLGAPSRG